MIDLGWRPSPGPGVASGEAVVVTGAASQIGWFLLPRLAEAGFTVVAVSRRDPVSATARFGAQWAGHGRVQWRQDDINRPGAQWARGAKRWIHLGPLELAGARVAEASAVGVRQVVAFGSTSRYTKANSSAAVEQRLVARLLAGESALASRSEAAGAAWTLFRPTLIHGAGLDRNVMVIAGAIRRFGLFPLVGGGRGLRQPVHADDLAAACVSVLGREAAARCAYDLSGGEVLSYRAMVERVFEALERPARFLPVPVAVVGLALRALSLLPRYRDFNPEMARRMAADMVFGHEAATRDFGYRPRGFEPRVRPPD